MRIPPSRHWDELMTEDLAGAETADWIAVLPIAATEQHGPHLPLGTDTMIGEGLLGRALEAMPGDLPVVVLPTLPYGKSDEHRAFPGTISLSAEILSAMIVEIGAGVLRAGIRKLVILSSHGGNSEAMSIAGRTLRLDFEMLVVATNWMRLGQPAGLFAQHELRHGIHAGDVETSLMLRLEPDLVRRDRVADFPSASEAIERRYGIFAGIGGTGMSWAMEDLNAAGAVGSAASATAAKGEASAAYSAGRLVTLLREIHDFRPEFFTNGRDG
ncbi:creatininase family protein [Lutibaculum baratangense]|uniref:Creatinine amidohydrolase n=1 Tax=Lutibaculum baratangense AMV1 TaxID=631454 RepID=V4R2Q5_9HYPH|nr:creatininase family protein [Lutibaculum baratangense]ESR26237.1 Creatinine amidohydrolase [Lutibaculum baratangense AMV1]